MKPAGKRPSLSVLLGFGGDKAKGKGKVDEDPEDTSADDDGGADEESEVDEGQEAAGSALIDAVKAGDGHAVAVAIGQMFDLLEAREGDDEDGGDDHDDEAA